MNYILIIQHVHIGGEPAEPELIYGKYLEYPTHDDG